MASGSSGEYVLHGVHVACGYPSLPTASVSLTAPNGKSETQAATGTGPVDAICKAVNKIVRRECDVEDYIVHEVHGNLDAVCKVTIKVQGRGEGAKEGMGSASDTDILVASAKAYVMAINELVNAQGG